jgi:5-methylcytosine-specific restriction endonuclease McrA
MSPRTVKRKKTGNLDQVLAEAKRNQELRQVGYRDRALKLFPHVCGRCGREFEGKNLKDLTVHHKDHNHDNNPSDGSNWELLCIYCHDMEHQKYLEAEDNGGRLHEQERFTDYKPFAELNKLVKGKLDTE